MPEIHELVQEARVLGERLAQNPRVQSYFAAQRALQQDAAAQELLQEYSAHGDHLRELETEQKPIEVTDKRKLQELENRVRSNERLKELMRAQADYVELMNRVNAAMSESLNAAATGPDS
jgi:cell fate (sporulation/competence/biofilm development) regulator YlbF (YheA/YmcA/DUF963 family)